MTTAHIRRLVNQGRLSPIVRTMAAKDLPWCKGKQVRDPEERIHVVLGYDRKRRSRKPGRITYKEPMLFEDFAADVMLCAVDECSRFRHDTPLEQVPI